MFGIKKVTEALSEMKALLMKGTQETDQHLQKIENTLYETSQKSRQDSVNLQPLEDAVSSLHALEDTVRNLQSDVKRHDMSIEDMLESWDEFQEQQKESAGRLSQEKQLIDLCIAYEQQLHSICRMAADDPAWKKQMELMELQLQPVRTRAGVIKTGKEGEALDYSLHEVISVQDTEEEGKNGLIESTYEPGFCFRGCVIRKAKVSAYRYHSRT